MHNTRCLGCGKITEVGYSGYCDECRGKERLINKTKKIYISGPMSGIENNNFEAFENAKKILINQFNEIISPVDIARKVESKIDNPVYSDYLKADIKELLDCDAIYMLYNWEFSRGAYTEFMVAKSLGLKFIFQTSIKLELKFSLEG